MSRNLMNYSIGDHVCMRGKGDTEYVVGAVNTETRSYTLINLRDEGSLLAYKVHHANVWRFFRVRDPVIDLSGRTGVVYKADCQCPYVDVVFDEPSASQLSGRKRYETTPSGKFVTRIDRNSLRIDYSRSIIEAEEVDFDESEFLKMIGGM